MNKLLLFFIPAIIGSNFSIAQTALDFDGTNDYVTCGNILTPSYTKEAWIYYTNTSLNNNMISGGTTGQHAFWAPSSYSNKLSSGHNSVWDAVQDPVALVVGTWYHVAVSYNDVTGEMKLYKNGALVDSTTGVAPHTAGNLIQIGAYDPAANLFQGKIDDVRLWDTVRTGAEILANMDSCLTGSETGLVALYNFEDGSGPTLTDLTSNGFNGTLLNMDTIADWVTGKSCIPMCFPIDTSTSVLGFTITSNATGGATYRWLDCDNGSAIIPGKTNQNFTATANGNYAVEITDSICVDTSACVNISGVSISENNFSSTITVSPNPTNNMVHINLSNHNGAIHYTLSSIEGRMVYQEQNVTRTNIAIDLSNENKGIYLLKINNLNSAAVYKIVKQ